MQSKSNSFPSNPLEAEFIIKCGLSPKKGTYIEVNVWQILEHLKEAKTVLTGKQVASHASLAAVLQQYIEDQEV